MARGGSGPRQPGGGRRIAGPRDHDRSGFSGGPPRGAGKGPKGFGKPGSRGPDRGPKAGSDRGPKAGPRFASEGGAAERGGKRFGKPFGKRFDEVGGASGRGESRGEGRSEGRGFGKSFGKSFGASAERGEGRRFGKPDGGFGKRAAGGGTGGGKGGGKRFGEGAGRGEARGRFEDRGRSEGRFEDSADRRPQARAGRPERPASFRGKRRDDGVSDERPPRDRFADDRLQDRFYDDPFADENFSGDRFADDRLTDDDLFDDAPAGDSSEEHRSDEPRSDEPRSGARSRDDRPARCRRAEPEPAQDDTPATAVQTIVVSADEAGMRVDRFFEAHFPSLSFSHIQRIVRKGEVRVNGKRVDTKDRLEEGQSVRVPPLRLAAPAARENPERDAETRAFLKSITLLEDDDILVLNKPMGLAVQGGSGTKKHVDGMLEVLRDARGQKPRLVHRLDKDTSGCLLVAKTRFAASTLAKSFRARETRKIYWALAAGVPKPKQGRISTFLAKEEREEESFMRIAKHGEEGAIHAVTYYAVVETAAQRLAWLSLKPVTGRTHQLRAHLAHIGHPIVGDPKYFSIENWQLPGGIQNRLHLMARRLVIPHPRGGTIDVTAPLPPHMVQSFNLLGFDAARYDPITDAPDED
ncbi:Ribosomal large subunit pseudouridine synthase C [Rhodovulum sp. PH10]|uniref:RluA family pseudouridine synthase n=1 Tax=Rhodovulum sp. PH10 TaxID=1187851 RepID=UPI00027C2A20|nr:RluA family pseudouridine synthase [Rhodovulum sp. PH10]EJW12230.1 Ribosomal large subunit pseudouridine synthase C [Rhodovulum sp. PH10]